MSMSAPYGATAYQYYFSEYKPLVCKLDRLGRSIINSVEAFEKRRLRSRRTFERSRSNSSPVGCENPRHATKEYSWTTPPRRSRREIRASPNDDADTAPARLVAGGTNDS